MTESIINDQESRETINNFPKWIDAISSPVIIVTDEGKVRYSNFHCREHLEVNSGDTVLMNRYRDKLVGIRKTAQNENPDLWIKVSSFFQIDYEGEKANMLLVEASQKEHTEIHSTKKLII